MAYDFAKLASEAVPPRATDEAEVMRVTDVLLDILNSLPITVDSKASIAASLVVRVISGEVDLNMRRAIIMVILSELSQSLVPQCSAGFHVDGSRSGSLDANGRPVRTAPRADPLVR